MNALWEGVNNELRTPLAPPLEMLFWGERIYAVQGQWGRLPASPGVSQLLAALTLPSIFLGRSSTFPYLFLPWKSLFVPR